MKRILILLAPILFLSACLSVKPVSVQNVEGLNINSPDMNEIEVALTLKIDNPNNYAITVKKIDLNVNAGGIDLGKVLVEQKVKIPAKSVTSQTFNFNVSLSQLGAAAIPAGFALLSKGDLKIKAEGKIKAKAFLISKNFPVNFSDEVNLKSGR